jgi:hypothetical protein
MKESNPVYYLSVHHAACRDNRHKNFSSCARVNSIKALSVSAALEYPQLTAPEKRIQLILTIDQLNAQILVL